MDQVQEAEDITIKTWKENQEDKKKGCVVVPNTNLVDGVAGDKKPKKK